MTPGFDLLIIHLFESIPTGTRLTQQFCLPLTNVLLFEVIRYCFHENYVEV